MSAKIINESIEDTPLTDLRPHPRNPRQGDLGAVHESIVTNGFFGAIVAQRSTGYVLAGNHRLKAAEAAGLSTLPTAWVDVDDELALRILLADNRTSDIATYDDAELAKLLKEIAHSDRGLAGTGYDGDDLDQLLSDIAKVEVPREESVPEVEDDADSEVGQVYRLGPHMLACGDSTDPEMLRAAADGLFELDAMWTDPPYGVAYEGKTSKKLTIKNDRLGAEQLLAFLLDAFQAADAVLAPGAAVYVASPSGPLTMEFGRAMEAMAWFRQRLVWDKGAMVLGHSDYHYEHEDIYFGYKPGPGRRGREGQGWYGDDSQKSILRIPKPAANRDHPTMKPPDLIVACLRNSLRPEGRVLDPFGGSGSTMVAAHALNAKAHLVELDPRYCDVIRRRWTALCADSGEDPGPDAL